MANVTRNPWKLATIGLLLVAATAAGVTIATRNGTEEAKTINPAPASSVRRAAPAPSAADIEVCNRYANGVVGGLDLQRGQGCPGGRCRRRWRRSGRRCNRRRR